MNSSSEKSLVCPSCRQAVTQRLKGVWPFCSDRCKMLDLGSWMREDYRIAGSVASDEELEQELGNSNRDSVELDFGDE